MTLYYITGIAIIYLIIGFTIMLYEEGVQRYYHDPEDDPEPKPKWKLILIGPPLFIAGMLF